jgi:CheY-like chemotaxis protein
MRGEAHRLKILLVEDSEDNRLMLKRLLEMSGYEVVEAVNGEQAVQRAKTLRPDVILMDLSLPRIDGLTATRRIRNMPHLKKVPIIAITAHMSADFQTAAFASGCNEYMNKPIDFGHLESLLKRFTSSN